MKNYLVQTKFSIAKADETQLDLSKGSYIEFDGTTALYEGTSYKLPRLSVAITANWIKEVGGVNPEFTPKSATMALSAATPQQEATVSDGTASITEEESVLNSVSNHKAFVKDPHSVRKTMEFIQAGADEAKKLETRFKTATKNGNVSVDQISDQEVSALDPSSAGGAYTQNEGITFKNEGISAKASQGLSKSVTQVSFDPSQQDTLILGKISDSKDNSVPSQVASEPDVELEDTLDPEVKEGRFAVAKLIHPEFPEWDFTLHWSKKIQKLKNDHQEDVPFLRAIYACESEALKKRIKKEFTLGL
jgi:hypothetical protein